MVSSPGLLRNADTTGAILMASGRVPNTTITFILDISSGSSQRSAPRWAKQVRSERRPKLRQHLEQIPHQADIGDLEDRGVRVFVDSHDGAGVLDAGQVLDGAADADRHVQLRGDDFSGLTYLHLVGHVTGVDGGARSTHRGPQLVGEVEDDLEVLLRAHAAAAGNDALGA